MTDIQQALAQATEQLAASSDTPLLDAEVLLCHCLDKPRSFLRAWPEKLLEAATYTTFSSLIAERQHGMPVAYLTGTREFWSREFQVTTEVLIPRPDTELLIELSLSLLPKHPLNILDLGTGSGIIGITLAAERPDCRITACDVSPSALDVAESNARKLNIQNITFIHSNWLENINDKNFDLIISNPPYIDAEDPHLTRGDVRFEPKSALVSSQQGLSDIKHILQQSAIYLQKSGLVMLEHGYQQQNEVQAIFKKYKYQNISTHKDLAGHPRATVGSKP